MEKIRHSFLMAFLALSFFSISSSAPCIGKELNSFGVSALAFLMNATIVKQEFMRRMKESGVMLVIIDLGKSFQKVARFMGEDAAFIEYKQGLPLGINPFNGSRVDVLQSGKLDVLAKFVFARLGAPIDNSISIKTNKKKVTGVVCCLVLLLATCLAAPRLFFPLSVKRPAPATASRQVAVADRGAVFINTAN